MAHERLGDTEGTVPAKTGEAMTSKGASLETPGDAQVC